MSNYYKQILAINNILEMIYGIMFDIDKVAENYDDTGEWKTFDIIAWDAYFSFMLESDKIYEAKNNIEAIKNKLMRLESDLHDMDNNSSLNFYYKEFSARYKPLENSFSDYIEGKDSNEDYASLLKIKNSLEFIVSDLESKKIELENN